MEVKEDTITSKGATFILKNTTDEEYRYGPSYTIVKIESRSWKEIDTITGEPLTWNLVIYTIKSGEEKELYLEWSLGYGNFKRV